MIKNAVKALFSLVGYSLTRQPKPPAPGFSTVRVGDFDIRIDNLNGLRYDYVYCKAYGKQLIRLARTVYNHYPAAKAVDIGSNIGDSVALIKSGADLPVICIEGDELLVPVFKQNTAQFGHITLHQTFLSDQPESIACSFTKQGHNMTIKPADNPQDKVALTNFSTIDELFLNNQLDRDCKLLKVDTEGFDLKIIRGGEKFIGAVKPIILFECNRENLANVETNPFGIFGWLRDRGYLQVLFYENDGTFMFSAELGAQRFLKQLFDYVDGVTAKVPYLDIVVFHSDDSNMAEQFITGEEENRAQQAALRRSY